MRLSRSNACNGDICAKEARIVGLHGPTDGVVNKGPRPKGMKGWQANHNPERLPHPPICPDGRLIAGWWGEAMGLHVERTQAVRESYTTSAIGFYDVGPMPESIEHDYADTDLGRWRRRQRRFPT